MLVSSLASLRFCAEICSRTWVTATFALSFCAGIRLHAIDCLVVYHLQNVSVFVSFQRKISRSNGISKRACSKRKFIKPIFDTSFRLLRPFLMKGTYFANGKYVSLIEFTSAEFFLTV